MRLTTLPSCVHNFQIRALDLSHNALSDLPKEFGMLNHLFTLALGHNNFQAIPPCVMRLKELHTLNLENNLIQSVPKSISGLTGLYALNLRNNPLDFTRVSLALSELNLGKLLVENGKRWINPVSNSVRQIADQCLHGNGNGNGFVMDAKSTALPGCVGVTLFHLHVIHGTPPPDMRGSIAGSKLLAAAIVEIYGPTRTSYDIPPWLGAALELCEVLHNLDDLHLVHRRNDLYNATPPLIEDCQKQAEDADEEVSDLEE
jgi:hypothetical protein